METIETLTARIDECRQILSMTQQVVPHSYTNRIIEQRIRELTKDLEALKALPNYHIIS